MNIRIITDSGSDYRTDELRKLTVIPLAIRFGESEYLDGVTLDPLTFYKKLVECDHLPQTSQPSPANFTDVFERVAQNDEVAIVITISSKLSGTYQNALLAARDYKSRIFVVDSLNATIGEHILVQHAIQLRDRGLSVGEIVTQLETKKQKIRLVALLDTLEYLKRGGRISATTAALGSLFSIKPVVGVHDGEVVILGKARGSRNGSTMLREKIISEGGIDDELPYCLGFAGVSDDLLMKYMDNNRDLLEGRSEALQYYRVGPAIGTHVGPGAIAVAYFKK